MVKHFIVFFFGFPPPPLAPRGGGGGGDVIPSATSIEMPARYQLCN
jgi:hypothetical protein